MDLRQAIPNVSTTDSIDKDISARRDVRSPAQDLEEHDGEYTSRVADGGLKLSQVD